MNSPEIRVLNLGAYRVFTEWMVDLGEDCPDAWFVRKYHQDSKARGWSAGDWTIEVFTSNSEALDPRLMTTLEIALFKRLLGPAA